MQFDSAMEPVLDRYLPFPQREQDIIPAVSWYVPGKHEVQFEGLTMPLPVPYWPTPHSEQLETSTIP